jgi:rare lipoprotein A
MTGRGLNLLILLLPLAIISGCSTTPRLIGSLPEPADSAPGRRLDPSSIPDAVPRPEPKSRYGNPKSYVVRGKRYQVMASSQGYRERGIASWYGTKFHGRRTSSGEPYDMYQMTAAHKTLPLPTYVEVRNLDNGRSTIVKVNDRGPFHENRIIDLSYAAATKLGILGKGTGLVEVRAIDPSAPKALAKKKTPPPPANDRPPTMFIQVGAFSSRFNADRQRQRVARSLQQQVSVQEGDHAGRPIYRVQIGPIENVEQADSISQKLATIGIDDAHVVIK